MLAERQHGVVTRKQLRAAGRSDDAIDRDVRNGELIRVHSAVYRIAGAPITYKSRIMAACLACGERAVAGRRTAAYLRRFIDRFPSPIEVLVPYDCQPRPDGFVPLRSRVPFKVTRVDNIPTTDPARTMLDLASVVPPEDLGVVLDRALRMRAVRLDALENELLTTRAKGSGNLRRLVAERVGRTLSEGDLESRFFELLDRLDIPAPKKQHRIIRSGVEIARLDIAYVDEKIAIEIDAYSDHSDVLSFVRDRRRNNLIAAEYGFTFLHFTRADLAKPRYVRDVLLRMLSARRSP